MPSASRSTFPRLALCVTALAATLTVGPSVTASAATADVPPVSYVLPAATDAAIGSPAAAHTVAVPEKPNGRLVVFLPGTAGEPSGYTKFVRQAAASGFDAIGLSYPNSSAVKTLCEDDLDCYGTVRQNVFDGTSASDQSSVEPVDAVQHRLAALLAYLDEQQPGHG